MFRKLRITHEPDKTPKRYVHPKREKSLVMDNQRNSKKVFIDREKNVTRPIEKNNLFFIPGRYILLKI